MSLDIHLAAFGGVAWLGYQLTVIQLQGVGGRTFKGANAELSTGLWVVLADGDAVGAEFTRLIAGLDRPRYGRLLINGYPPRLYPAVRHRVASLLLNEPFSLAKRADQLVAEQAELQGISLAPIEILRQLELQGLAERPTPSLTPGEARQIATALALAHDGAIVGVYCEPLMALSDAQVALFQQCVCELADHACILCVTSSLHDARLLGGPHARLTTQGWSAFADGSVRAGRDVYLEGPALSGLAAAIAARVGVTRICLQTAQQGPDTLEIAGAPEALTSHNVVSIARQTGTSITRMRSNVAVAGERDESSFRVATDERQEGVPFARRRLDELVRAVLRQIRVAARAFASLAGCTALFVEPALATVYAELQRSRTGSWASYEALTFLATVLVPIESLLLGHLMIANQPDAVEGMARYGTNRRFLAISRLLIVSAMNGALAAISAVVALSAASSGWSAPTIGDLVQAFWIVGLGGMVYGAIVGAFGRASIWRWAFVVADFLMGGTSRAISLPFPRAHIHNLLGAASAIDLPQRESCIILGMLLLLAIGLTAVRTDP